MSLRSELARAFGGDGDEPERPRTRDGFCRVYQTGGASFLAPLDCFDEIVAALRAGESWWEGPGFYGGRTFVRLATVTDVHEIDPDAQEAARADQEDEGEEPWQRAG